MNRKNILIVSASCLIAAAGMATAQPQNTPARQSVQTAERLSQMRGSLVEAIRAAEQHSNGTAIGARLSMNWTAFQQESLGHSQMDRQPMNQADRERIEREIREQNPNLSREEVSRQARERMDRDSRDGGSNQWNQQDDRQNLERIEREIRQQNPNLSREQVSAQARERMQRESRDRTGNQPNYQDDRQNRERIEREIRQQNPNLSNEQVATQARERMQRESRDRETNQPNTQTDRQNLERIEREIRQQNPNLSNEQVSAQARQRMERESRDRDTNQPNTQTDRQNLERIEREIRQQNPNLSSEQVSAQARERMQRERRDRGTNQPNTQTDRQNLERIEREIRQQNPNLSNEQVSAQARQRMERESRDRDENAGDHQPLRGVSDGSNINAPIDRDRGRDQDQWAPGRGQDQRSPEFTGSQGDELFAVITCVVDHARVREVIVDMRNNTVVGVYAIDALRDGNAFTSDDSSRYEREATQTRSAANVRASDLMNATARTADGKRIGDIDELAIDPDSNRVVYAVLRRGGFLGMGESRFAIPTSELSIPHDGRMHTSLNERDFEGQSGFDNNNWPTRADQQWSRTERAEGTPAPVARRIVKATNIIGSSVECRDGNELGKIKDLIVEPRSGRVVYAIVNSSNGYLPIPMEVLRSKGDRGGYSMPMTMTELRARPTIQANRDPNWNDTAWNRSIYESYGLTIDERYPQGDQNRDRRDDDRRNDGR